MSKELVNASLKNEIVPKNISESVEMRVNELVSQDRINLPKNYSVGNAIASAWLIIQDLTTRDGAPVLQACTNASIANSLLDMAVMGLNPAKKQGYFIPYGNKLTWFTSYFGKSAVVKRLKGIDTEPIATLIYDGDELELGHTELGEEIVTSHKKSWNSKLKGEIVGAYATLMQGDIKRSAVMTMSEIREAWMKNPSKGNRRDHTEFTGEFAKRTVINRLIKMILQTSNDDDLLAETLIKNEDNHYDFETKTVENVEEETKLEIATNANSGELIDIQEDEEVEESSFDVETGEVETKEEPKKEKVRPF